MTRLAAHRQEGIGLRLTRRVLRATLKYPWLSPEMPAQYREHRKYGAYLHDAEAFRFATSVPRDCARAPRSIDAAIMDAADAITYSVHDLFDFYRAGLIELGRTITMSSEERAEIAGRDRPPVGDADRGLEQLLLPFTGWHRYADTRGARADVQRLTSRLITELLSRHELRWDPVDGWTVEADDAADYAMDFLKGLTRRHVMDSDTLAVTQVGHRRVIRRLFKLYIRSLVDQEHRVFPPLFRDEARRLGRTIARDASGDDQATGAGDAGPGEAVAPHDDSVRSESTIDPIERVPEPLRLPAARLAADVVASLTDRQALSLNLRVSGLIPQDGFAGQRVA